MGGATKPKPRAKRRGDSSLPRLNQRGLHKEHRMIRTAPTMVARRTALRISATLVSSLLWLAVVPQCTRDQQLPANTSPAAAADAKPKPRVEESLPRLLAQPRKVRTLEGQTSYPSAASFSPDDRRVVTASDDKLARLWDADPNSKTYGKLLRTLEGHTGSVFSASFSPDGRRALTGSVDNTARLWDADPNSKTYGELLCTLKGHTGWVRAASFSPDGRWMLTAADDGTARLWDAASQSASFGTEIARFDAGQPITAAAFNADGRRVVLAAGTWAPDPTRSRGEVQIWHVTE